jgi:hypothetical protein
MQAYQYFKWCFNLARWGSHVGGNLDKLEFFRANRTVFWWWYSTSLDLPVTGGVAYLNSFMPKLLAMHFLVFQIFASKLPTQFMDGKCCCSWNGTSFSSHHTCVFWNGDNTAIDACGLNFDIELSEGCDDGPIPADGGTVWRVTATWCRRS